jgi:hypothetical protein
MESESVGETIHPEGATPEVQDGAFLFDPASEGGGHKIFAPLTDCPHIDDSSILEDSQMFRRIVLSDFQTLGQFVDSEIRGEQRLDDSLAGTVGERL